MRIFSGAPFYGTRGLVMIFRMSGAVLFPLIFIMRGTEDDSVRIYNFRPLISNL